MPYGIRLLARGTFACFTRPEMKVERVSYDVITPSAARGLLEAIYWKPQIRWVIDRLHVLAPIQFTNIRRNEVGAKTTLRSIEAAMHGDAEENANLGIAIDELKSDGTPKYRQQRAGLVLRDVCYGVEAHFEILDRRFEKGGPPLPENDCAGKHLDMFNRRAARGQHFHQPYFGCREFPADCEAVTDFPPSPYAAEAERDLGWMLHDIDFAHGRAPRFFRATMVGGVIAVPPFATATPTKGGAS
jgi:CRISPR-associated protein Cas5d